jgi:hypothetical protein
VRVYIDVYIYLSCAISTRTTIKSQNVRKQGKLTHVSSLSVDMAEAAVRVAKPATLVRWYMRFMKENIYGGMQKKAGEVSGRHLGEDYFISIVLFLTATKD